MRAYKLLSGALGGFLGTIPMTVVMTAWHRRLAWRDRSPLPPRKINDQVLRACHVSDEMSESQKRAMTVVSHFGYGTSMGAIFGMLPRTNSPSLGIVSGMAFGLGVWAGSYLVWLPLAGLHRSATKEPSQRNLLMIASHLVWGGSLGLMTNVIRRGEPEISTGEHGL